MNYSSQLLDILKEQVASKNLLMANNGGCFLKIANSWLISITDVKNKYQFNLNLSFSKSTLDFNIQSTTVRNCNGAISQKIDFSQLASIANATAAEGDCMVFGALLDYVLNVVERNLNKSTSTIFNSIINSFDNKLMISKDFESPGKSITLELSENYFVVITSRLADTLQLQLPPGWSAPAQNNSFIMDICHYSVQKNKDTKTKVKQYQLAIPRDEKNMDNISNSIKLSLYDLMMP